MYVGADVMSISTYIILCTYVGTCICTYVHTYYICVHVYVQLLCIQNCRHNLEIKGVIKV